MASIRKRHWNTSKGDERISWTVDWRDNSGGRQRKQFSKRKEAEKFRIKIEGQLSNGTYRPDADNVKIKEICEAFLEYCEGRMKRNERMTRKTLTVYRGHVKCHILHLVYGIGNFRLSQLTARAVGGFRDRIREAGVTVPTARKVLATLHTMLEYAISQDLLAINAARGVKVIGPRDEGSKKIVPPSKADLKIILEAANPDLRLKLLFAATTGLRAGEQWALRWNDVDFNARELRIKRRVDVYGVEGPPKSAAGIRTMPISQHLSRMLKEW